MDDLPDDLLLSAADELETSSVTRQELSGSQGYFIISVVPHFVLTLFHLSVMNENSTINYVVFFIFIYVLIY